MAEYNLPLDDLLRPLIRETVRETIAQMGSDKAQFDGQLAYTEEQAAALLGLRVHQLRDERLRGRIAASVIVGRRVRYLRADLVAYLMARRTGN
jgi:hypothetical protein